MIYCNKKQLVRMLNEIDPNQEKEATRFMLKEVKGLDDDAHITVEYGPTNSVK